MATLAGLTALYKALGGASWITNTNWLSNADPCDPSASWHGLVCVGAGPKGIDLDGNGLRGTLPTQLGLLTELRYALDLYNNQIHGHLPTQLAHLTYLWSFDLHRNELSGTLPTELGNLSGLRSFLYAHENPALSGTLPSQIGRLVQLRMPLGVFTT